MPALDVLRHKIRTIQKLHSLVKTMKVLAAVSIRQYERAVESLSEYDRTIELGLQIVLRSRRARDLRAGSDTAQGVAAVVFGSDYGLCGQFNEQIVAHATRSLNALRVAPARRLILALGERTRVALENANQAVAHSFPLPGSLTGITPMVQQIVTRIESWRQERGVGQVVLYFNRFVEWSYRPTTLRLLPLDPEWLESLRARRWENRVLPAYRLRWDLLFRSLIRQYLLVSLFRAVAESLAAENASRLRAMQAAQKNIEERLEGLTVYYYRQRQDAITEELLDIVAGCEALAAGQQRRPAS